MSVSHGVEAGYSLQSQAWFENWAGVAKASEP